MIKLIVEEKEYNLPTTWEEVTIEQFQKLDLIGKNLDEVDSLCQIISTLSGMPMEEIDELPYTCYKDLKKALNYLATDMGKELKYMFELNNEAYGLSYDVPKYSTREYLDADTLSKDKENMVDNLHLLMAVLYRPVTEVGENTNKLGYKIAPYKTEDLEARGILFKNAPITIAIAAMLFFSAYAISLSESFLDSLTNPIQEQKEPKMKKSMKKKIMKASKKDGDGL